jgi:hypothetical protein
MTDRAPPLGLRTTPQELELSASARNYGDVSPVPRTAPRTPGALSMPARPYPGSVRSASGPPCRGRARRVPMRSMGVAQRLGSARGTWNCKANVYVIEFVSACTKVGRRSLSAWNELWMKLLRTTGTGDNIRNIKNEGNRRLRRFSVPLLPKALLPLPQSEETAIPPSPPQADTGGRQG